MNERATAGSIALSALRSIAESMTVPLNNYINYFNLSRIKNDDTFSLVRQNFNVDILYF